MEFIDPNVLLAFIWENMMIMMVDDGELVLGCFLGIQENSYDRILYLI